jgi:acyl-CoA synthetase (AMP-forming)/AMP-acid ligase II
MIEEVDFQSDRPALLREESSDALSYRQLERQVAETRDLLRALPQPAVVFQFATNELAAITGYLACLGERIPIGLGDPAAAARDRVIKTYAPTGILLEHGVVPPTGYEKVADLPGGGMSLWQREDRSPYAVVPHPDLALLLATSGSTGDAKLVRLSRANLLANARSIVEYLGLSEGERALQSLPIHYSYGLSVLNSHLIAGASLVLTKHSFIRPEFWRVVDECGCTSFAGVPYMYETLHRLRINPAGRPSIKTLTQAGGALRPELIRHFQHAAGTTGARLFVMYGQTEAAPRMAYVPPELLSVKIGSIGVAISGGKLWLEPVVGEETAQQIFYRGLNVMLGYAQQPADLARGDDQHGVLATGDLGECDADGFFRVTGRLARFAKLFGKRIDLGTVESEVEAAVGARAAVLDGGNTLRVFLEKSDRGSAEQARTFLAEFLGVPPTAVVVEPLAEIPMTPSGKKDYKALR